MNKNIELMQGNCLDVMQELLSQNPDGLFDMIFADPPYFLSNGGISCKNGKQVKVDKGDWDKSKGADENHAFNLQWLELCQKLLKSNGTIWVSGTSHVIFSIGYAMQQLGFKMLNDIIWEKPNPPPNLACRNFTHATETVLWAAKNVKSKHCFNYADMKMQNDDKQMKSVWRFTAPKPSEKTHGKHPTQKPLELLRRCIEASTKEGDKLFDPFMGSGTTGVAAIQLGRKFYGVELESEFLDLAKIRINDALETKQGMML